MDSKWWEHSRTESEWIRTCFGVTFRGLLFGWKAVPFAEGKRRGSNRFGAGGVWIKTFIPNYAHLKALLDI